MMESYRRELRTESYPLRRYVIGEHSDKQSGSRLREEGVASRPSEPVRSSRPSEPVRSSRPSEPVRSSRPSEPLRSNARQNRDRILAVAHEALIASSDASLNSIAKRAGVGIATVYRHFPTREALVLEVYRHEVTQLAEAAPALLASHPPLDALRKWMDRLAH